MDQLKPAIEFCKKQYFWILLSLLSLVSIAGFVMTKMSLAAQLKSQQALVDSKYSSVQEVMSKASTHPNENSHKEMDRIVGAIAEDVRKAWELQYLRQVKIMQWPNSLGPDFVALVDKYRPIETLQFPLTQEPLGVPYRERFRDYVDPLFPRLAKIIGANWEATVDDIVPGGTGGGLGGGIGGPTGPAGGRGGPGGMDPGGMMGGPEGAGTTGITGPKPLVYWQPASQKELMQNVLWWHNKQKVPSTLEILYTQEDLWIIEGLMNIIKATNGDAQESFQAAIKEIEFLRIGKSAVGRAGTLTSLGSTGNMGMGMGMGAEGSSGMPMPGAGGDGGDQMGMGSSGAGPTPGSEGMGGMLEGGSVDGAAATQSSPDPAAGRYVDTAFQPIAGEMLRTVVSSGALNPTDAPLAVAKRVPVRMRFKMDQRKLNRLLTECGNADLLFEIRQVRINTEAHGEASASGMMGGAMGGGRAGPSLGGSAGTPGLGAPDSGMEGSGGGGSAVVGAAKSYDLPVEIYGIVYLFNPVDMNKLGIEKVTADTQIENVGRVSAEESTGIETDRSATTDGGAAAANPGNPATPPADPGVPATPPATPAVPDGSASGGVAPEGATPTAPPGTPPAAGAPASGAPAGPGPAAGPGTPAVPALPSAG